jgi:hypothetical protein
VQIKVWHVGTPKPALLDADAFSVDDSGTLTLVREDRPVAFFAGTKWSAAFYVAAELDDDRTRDPRP